MFSTPSRGVDVHREDLLHLSPPLPSLVSVITSAITSATEDPSEQEGPEDNGCNINNVDDGRDNDNDDGRDEVDGEVAGLDDDGGGTLIMGPSSGSLGLYGRCSGGAVAPLFSRTFSK